MVNRNDLTDEEREDMQAGATIAPGSREPAPESIGADDVNAPEPVTDPVGAQREDDALAEVEPVPETPPQGVEVPEPPPPQGSHEEFRANLDDLQRRAQEIAQRAIDQEARRPDSEASLREVVKTLPEPVQRSVDQQIEAARDEGILDETVLQLSPKPGQPGCAVAGDSRSAEDSAELGLDDTDRLMPGELRQAVQEFGREVQGVVADDKPRIQQMLAVQARQRDQFEAETVELANGERVGRAEFDALSPDQQAD